MRLFYTQYKVTDGHITCHEQRVIKHMHVLRMKKWDMCLFQQAWTKERYLWEIIEYNKKGVVAKVREHMWCQSEQKRKVSMIIGLPNSFAKCQIIVQKLSEIWVHKIIFWKSDHSQWSDLHEKKREKLSKIALESLEQCNAWELTQVKYTKGLKEVEEVMKKAEHIVFGDMEEWLPNIAEQIDLQKVTSVLWVIWPEGHFSPDELRILGELGARKVSLWGNILRTETASIVTSRWLMQG